MSILDFFSPRAREKKALVETAPQPKGTIIAQPFLADEPANVSAPANASAFVFIQPIAKEISMPSAAEVKSDLKKFVSALEVAGKDFLKGLVVAEKYAVPIETLAAIIYPPSVAIAAPAVTALGLIQTAVTEVEQKYAAAAAPSTTETSEQKLSDALTIVGPTVEQLLAEPSVAADLAKAGITVNSDYIKSLINAVVAILNAQPAAIAA